MHILMGLLTAAAGLVWALYKLHNSGVDLNGLNPFYWWRRRQWQQGANQGPLYTLDHPMEVAAVLTVAMAQEGGVMVRETQESVIKSFEKEFNISAVHASQLFQSSLHVVKDRVNISGEVRKVLSPSRVRFSEAQRESTIRLLRAAMPRSNAEYSQRALLEAVEKEFHREVH